MKTIFEIILIILVSSATGDTQLKRRQNGDLARLYAHAERQRDTRSAGNESLASTFILKLSDTATHDDVQHLIELLRDGSHNASLYQWEGVTTGIAVSLNATALYRVRQESTTRFTFALLPSCITDLA